MHTELDMLNEVLQNAQATKVPNPDDYMIESNGRQFLDSKSFMADLDKLTEMTEKTNQLLEGCLDRLNPKWREEIENEQREKINRKIQRKKDKQIDNNPVPEMRTITPEAKSVLEQCKLESLTERYM